MTIDPKAHQSLIVHLTNVTGTGATQLLKSLLPSLERCAGARKLDIHLPDFGELAGYVPATRNKAGQRYRRYLPKLISRLMECVIFARRFSGNAPLLVLGDLPLRCNAPQVVFVQTPHLARLDGRRRSVKLAIARSVFRMNARYVDAFIVQTPAMLDALRRSYPEIAGRIHVIAQPVPSWLLSAGLLRRGPKSEPGHKLRLAYPAASYPHKNHRLLSGIPAEAAEAWPVRDLLLTVPLAANPAPEVSWVRCVGLLCPERIIDTYNEVDGIVFLSTDESYGFPLLEAMFVGLPVICPDLPYARTLCGDGAIYFDPYDVDSLKRAVDSLHRQLAIGWWPDWSTQLKLIPADWDTVAAAMLRVVYSFDAALHRQADS